MVNDNTQTMPIEVCILTKDHDIKGTVHVSKLTKANRELTELLNDKDRRFLAVTNAEIMGKNSSSAPRRYDFLEVHMDSIVIIHPATQVLFKETSKAQEDIRSHGKVRDSVVRYVIYHYERSC